MRLPRLGLHLPTLVGRMRAAPGPLVLMGLVVALTTALTSAVSPLMDRTSDHALAHAVREAGDQGAVVASFAQEGPDYGGTQRDPHAVEKFRAAVTGAHYQLPSRVAAVLQPGIASVTTAPLQLLDAGPDRYLRLAFVDGPTGAPPVRYLSGGPPRATVGPARAKAQLPTGSPPWPVQVAVSQAAARALGLRAGDRVPARDDRGTPVAVKVSGIFAPDDPHDPVWQTLPLLLGPAQGVLTGHRTASAAALVSSSALPDLELAVPSTDLTERVVALPRPDSVRWASSSDLVRALAGLQAAPPDAGDGVSWDTGLGRVVDDGRDQVSAARGQASVLLVGLLLCALLVLWQAADLLVRRRADSVVLAREHGATLVAVAAGLFLEAASAAVAGAFLGLVGVALTLGQLGWDWWIPLPLGAATAAAATAAWYASRAADPRRRPANRTARRGAARGRRLRRALFVATLVAGAALSFLALRQRGVLDGRGGAAAQSAPTWWVVAGAVLVLTALPALTRLLLDASRPSTGAVPFFVAARVRDAGVRALPLLVVMVAVGQLTFAVVLTSTERRGQADSALLAVGGDARVTTASGSAATTVARRVGASDGVRAAVAARVEDQVRATSRESADTVRLVVVDASAYQHLLAVSALPDAPQLDRLGSQDDGAVPALLLGGPPGLGQGLTVHQPEGADIRLAVVGAAPRVQSTSGPVVVVDTDVYAAAGGVTAPDTVWAVGPGAAGAVHATVGGTGSVVLLADVLAARRDAPLAAGLVRLGIASSALLLMFAVLGVAMAAASEAGSRATALGRLRSLGLRDGQLWRLVAGELLVPVVVGTLAGSVLGLSAAGAMFGHLSLERISDQTVPPRLDISPWVLLVGAVLVVTVLVLSHREWTRLRRVPLGELLRGGSPR